MIKQVLTHFRRQVGLGVKQKRSDIVLQGTFATALIVHKKWLAVPQQNVARLKIAIQKIITWSAEQKVRQARKIVFQCLLVERNARQPQKIIFEVIQVPGDRLPVKASDRITDLIVQVAARFHLKTRQHRYNFAICINNIWVDALALPIFRQELKKGHIPKVFFEVSAGTQIFAVDLRHRQSVLSKVS